jgi:hypothetical protein
MNMTSLNGVRTFAVLVPGPNFRSPRCDVPAATGAVIIEPSPSAAWLHSRPACRIVCFSPHGSRSTPTSVQPVAVRLK